MDMETMLRQLLAEHATTTNAQLEDAVGQIRSTLALRVDELRQQSENFALETRTNATTLRQQVDNLQTQMHTLRAECEQEIRVMQEALPLRATQNRSAGEVSSTSGPTANGATTQTRNQRLKEANIRMQLPAEFTGARGERTLSWVISLEEYAEDLGLLPDDCVPLAKQLLRGDARLWLQAYSKAVRENRVPPLATWETFKQALLEEFPEPNSEWKATMKLLRPVVQQGNRSARAYISEMRRYFLDAGNSVNETTRVNLFWAGLNRGLRAKIDLHMPLQTLEQCYKLAQHYDERFEVTQALDKANLPLHQSLRSRPPGWQHNSGTLHAQASVNSSTGLTQRNNPTPMEVGNTQTFCSYCKQKNHDERTCWRLHPELRPKKHGNGGQKKGQWKGRQGARVHNIDVNLPQDLPGDDSAENC